MSLEDLREAQVTSADLFVAVTPQDSTNITACLLATNLGAKKTLARTDKQEYLLPKNSEFFKSIGVDSLIFPEMLAAREISDALKKGWVRQYIELSDGALTVIAAKIHKNAPICGLALKDAFRGNNIVRTVVIRRAENTLVPSGNDLILDGDIVYFITTKDGIDEVRQKSGKENIHINEVMFMGASRVCIKAIEGLPSSMSCTTTNSTSIEFWEVGDSLAAWNRSESSSSETSSGVNSLQLLLTDRSPISSSGSASGP